MTETPSFDPRDKIRYVFHATPFRKIVLFVTQVVCKTIIDLRVEGLDNFPLDGPIILAANHTNNFDALAMQLSLPRPIFFMGKASLFKIPLLEIAYRQLGAFPVNPSEKDEWALRHAGEVLTHRQTLGMFPEGKHSRGKGLCVAKTGTARLALTANCPIVPVVVIGTDKFFKRFPHRTIVTVRVLSPILPKPGESALALMDRTMFMMADNLPQEMRGVYAERPKGFGR